MYKWVVLVFCNNLRRAGKRFLIEFCWLTETRVYICREPSEKYFPFWRLETKP